jgi:hypothetical protein
VNPEQAGSRFTSRAALAIVSSEGTFFNEDGDAPAGGAKRVLAEVFPSDPALGKPKPVDGGHGRGAEGWIAVAEFGVEAIIGGIAGNAAWDGIKLAAKRLSDLIGDLRRRDVKVFVSRGSAALLAIEHVRGLGEATILDVEAVTELVRSPVAG